MLWLELLAQRRGGPSGAFAALQLGAWAGFGMTLGVALALVPGLERAGYPHADAVQAAALAGAIQCVPIAVATCVSWAAVRRGGQVVMGPMDDGLYRFCLHLFNS